ncbi:hypothetical protein T492DRAFT_1109776 [Pavlovales sp. CCMP2436]|nr:hypothetical protein T492DRAFT_1109776 [Pavlovales sp. CCMP2436]
MRAERWSRQRTPTPSRPGRAPEATVSSSRGANGVLPSWSALQVPTSGDEVSAASLAEIVHSVTHSGELPAELPSERSALERPAVLGMRVEGWSRERMLSPSRPGRIPEATVGATVLARVCVPLPPSRPGGPGAAEKSHDCVEPTSLIPPLLLPSKRVSSCGGGGDENGTPPPPPSSSPPSSSPPPPHPPPRPHRARPRHSRPRRLLPHLTLPVLWWATLSSPPTRHAPRRPAAMRLNG